MNSNPLEGFTLLFGLAEGVGGLSLTLITIWLGSYRGGFAWTSQPNLEFNWHPLLMTMGMIFLYANAILVYRSFRSSHKKNLKIAHAIINAVAFILIVIGLQAVFDSHNLALPSPIPNMYSLHSWVGLAAVILFACQWITGLITFLYPTLGVQIRAMYYPVHVFFGINAFVCATAAALLGLTEKALFAVKFFKLALKAAGYIICGKTNRTQSPEKDYSEFSSEGLLINFIGVTIVIFASLVVHLVSEAKYKRQPLPEDELLLTSSE